MQRFILFIIISLLPLSKVFADGLYLGIGLGGMYTSTGPLDLKYKNNKGEVKSADKQYKSAGTPGFISELALGYMFRGGNGIYISPEAFFFYQSGTITAKSEGGNPNIKDTIITPYTTFGIALSIGKELQNSVLSQIYGKIGMIATPITFQVQETGTSYQDKGVGFLAGLIVGLGLETKVSDTLVLFTEARYTYVNASKAYHYSKSEGLLSRVGVNKLMLHGVGATIGIRIYASSVK
jgi:opacity protein-like surface antigen